MRTRFLYVDYFSSAANGTPENLNFLRLPIPYIAPSKLCDEVEHLCFDSVPTISLEKFERFPIENALTQFLSEVLPQSIFVGTQDFEKRQRGYCSKTTEIQHAEKEAEIFCEDKQVEIQRAFGTRTLQLEIQQESTDEEKDVTSFKGIQFEAPELDFFLEELACVFEDEDKLILSELPDIETSLLMHNENLGDTILYPCTVSESVYSVQNIILEYHMEQRSSFFVEETGSVQDKTCLCPIKYPLLEVNEIGLEFYNHLSIEEELHLLLGSIGHQQRNQEDNLMVDGKELLGSRDVDVLECLSEHSPLQLCLDPEPACLDLVLELDFINLNDGVFFPMMSPVNFQEVQILDLDSFQSFGDVVVGSQIAKETKICDRMFREDSDCIGNFYKLIVNQELALVDDSFKSLPLPVLCDDKEILSLSDIVEEFLTDIKPCASSVSDGIYLDWNLLQEDRCNHDICSTYLNTLEDIDSYNTGIELKSVNDEMLVIDFIFCDDIADRSKLLESKEVLNETLTDVGPSPSQLLKNGCQNPGIGKERSQRNIEKAPHLFKSISCFNDLDFFLKPQITSTSEYSVLAVKEATDAEAKLQKWDIEVHRIKLSENILSLIDNFQKTYLAILENDMDLKMKHRFFPDVDSLKLLSLPKQKLMDWIKNTTAQHTVMDHKDETLLTFVTLYAIKQMAYYLCFYGIHTTHLYVGNLSQSLNFRVRLSFLHSLIEDAYQKVNTEITESHPSLSAIQEILRLNTSQSGSKVLIVAEQAFWWPLKRLLTAMRISFDVQNIHNQQDVCDNNEFTNFMIDALLQSDCLLITHEKFSSSFPFNKFNIILEYGGSYDSSRISNIIPKLVGLPRVHFLKVELDDFSIPKALCEGVDVPKSIGLTMEGMSQLKSTIHEDIEDQKFEELLTFVPIDKYVHTESSEPADDIEAHSVPFSRGLKQVVSRRESFPDIIIIVNTQNVEKEMLISQRSSYQKILAMEKEGAQVVEREINLPVDLILTAAMCLVWYDCRKFGVKTTTEAFSVVPLLIETIATNILTPLSFAFGTCIMVFEGESRLLAAIMESSDGLYAASASLGIDLQLFCSHSSELTDDIILNCINHATKLSKSLYPKMLESETLAESFLTKFPSINPLSAHSILSSGGILVEFLEWSHEQRIWAIGKYHVPHESVTLFSALCRYGEHEESKSGMTDCSSVSSASDSKNIISKIANHGKKQKCSMSPQPIEIPMVDDILKPSGRSRTHQSWNFSKSHDILDRIPGLDFSQNEFFLDQAQGLDMSMINNSGWNGINRPQNICENFRDEAIGLSDMALLGDDDFSIENTVSFSTRKPKKGKDLKFRNSGCHPAFPTSADINSNSDIWNSLEDQNQRFEEAILGRTDTKTREFLVEKIMQRSRGDGQRPSQPFWGTPLSNAIYSSRLHQGSPWTIEFLNKIKEKSRFHQKSVQCNITSATCNRYSNCIEKIIKRKSPSILDGYRYQGVNNHKKIVKQKQFVPLKNENASASLLPTWTPIDKKARQTLSFARNGNETQSKLVWSDGNVHSPRKRSRNDA